MVVHMVFHKEMHMLPRLVELDALKNDTAFNLLVIY